MFIDFISPSAFVNQPSDLYDFLTKGGATPIIPLWSRDICMFSTVLCAEALRRQRGWSHTLSRCA